MNEYTSKFTGEGIDEGIEKSLESYENSIVASATLGTKCLNFIENKHRDNITKNGITATFQSDGGIKLNGTNTIGVFVLIWNMAYPESTGSGNENDHEKHVPNGSYILKSTGTADASIQISGSSDTGSSVLIGSASETDAEITIDDTYAYNHVRMRIGAGASFNDTVIYPMLVPKGVEVSGFVPYRLTLQKQIDALTARIEALEGNA